ncbi:hypothetical protein [Serratia proteamaculans]|uniref:hypothetical protein n=1 Tax=Serratia proteamaculans TaxID=28151 RepID=UPI003CFD5951
MIKRFNPDFSLSISHELAYMRETPEGGYVAHGDYATLFAELETVKAERDALEQRVNALAVENAALRDACGGDGDYRDCPGCTHSQYIEAPETPATSAALAAVRAQGVDMGVERITIIMNHQAPAVAHAINALNVLAAELREAK